MTEMLNDNIDFWDMPCVRISEINQLKRLGIIMLDKDMITYYTVSTKRKGA